MLDKEFVTKRLSSLNEKDVHVMCKLVYERMDKDNMIGFVIKTRPNRSTLRHIVERYFNVTLYEYLDWRDSVWSEHTEAEQALYGEYFRDWAITAGFGSVVLILTNAFEECLISFGYALGDIE